MKVAVSVIGKFHSFDLARELHKRGALDRIFSGYPRFKLRGEGLPAERIDTFPYLHTPYMAWPQRDLLGGRAVRQWEWLAKVSLDRYVARRLGDCDVFVGLSGSALRSGRTARRRGARHVCDRGSTHIRTQDELLREEHELWGVPYPGIDPRVVAAEEAEYAEADCITVPSTFTRQSFVLRGVPAAKLRCIPYGVDLTRFHPAGSPEEDAFDVLFVGGASLRKGIPYLLQAYAAIDHPRKSLTFAGAMPPELVERFRGRGLWPESARVLGHVAQPALKELMSRSHVLVLPSIEEGLALVQAQAMACGCVVVASSHTGADDLFTDGEEGYIVPIRNADALAARLQRLADDPERRRAMSARALLRVRQAGGWHDYGERAMQAYQGLLA